MNNKKPENNKKKNNILWISIGIAILAIIFMTIFIILMNKPDENEISYTELLTKISDGEVEKIEMTVGSTSVKVKLKDVEEEKNAIVPSTQAFIELIQEEKVNKNSDIELIQKPQNGFLSFSAGLLQILPTLLLVALIILVFKMQGFGDNGKVYDETTTKVKVKFDDVAGLKEEKQELIEIVEFLKNPEKFTKMGAKIPRGVLLYGKPGTGKTLIAKAIAGEAGVPFISMSGSEFIELFAGLGASRVRKLFEKARKMSPCIVFIDEIDAIGARRSAGNGAESENNQTLNQLLVEMDGFDTDETIIVLAATNRPEMLDKALLRPGRFDRQITVQIPDLRGREEILKIHAKEKKFAEDVNLKNIAEDTAGLTGAELANILNEAAIIATVNNHTAIEEQDIEEAVKKVTVGLQKVSRVYSEKDKKITAYHEAGHAIVSRYLPTQENVKEISIIPRGMAGGYTMYKSNEDKNYIEKTELEERLVALMGGRAAEYIIFHDISTGAANDIEVATEIAKNMVTVYGMSSLVGNISINTEKDPYELQILGEKFGDAIGAEIKLLLDGAYIKAQSIIKEHMEQLEIIAQTLLKKETIGEEEFKNILKEE